VNGNINRETVKVLDDKEHAIRDSTDSICAHEGSNVRDHFRNYCLTSVGKFSCAVDCFLKLCFFVFRNHLSLSSQVTLSSDSDTIEEFLMDLKDIKFTYNANRDVITKVTSACIGDVIEQTTL